jgi:hypothetical protein
MKQASCSQEAAVARAAATGIWPDALATHAKECGICRDVTKVAYWMRAVAGSVGAREANLNSQPVRPLPDAGAIWQRAHLDEGYDAKPGGVLRWVQLGLETLPPIGLASWVAWNWFSIQGAAEQFFLAMWPQLPAAAYSLALLAPAALSAAALALAYPVLDSE